MLDLIIRNGSVIDGTGRPSYKADLGIKDGKIVAIGDLRDAHSHAVIDADGLAVSPGFIDMHSHSDLSILTNRKSEESLSQGITTEVVGTCGWSLAPVKEETKNSVLKGLLTGLVDKKAFEGLEWSWHSFGEFMDYLSKAGIGTNVAPQVGQSLIRAHVVGTAKRNAAPGEIQAMKALLHEAMEAGAWGMSTGRAYKPGGHAPTEEIIELAKVVARYGGIYATHMKNEGENLLDAVEEVITIVEKSEVRAEISHHKAIGKKNFGKVNQSLSMIDAARRKGLPITVDVYPYEFSQVSSIVRYLPENLLRQVFPSGEIPEQEEILKALSDDSLMEKLRAMPEVASAAAKLRDHMVISSPSHPELEGHILGEVAPMDDAGLVSLLFDVLSKDGLAATGAWPISLDDVRSVLRVDFSTVGTDAFTLDEPISPTPIHPRHFGSFPRVVGRFVREGVLSLEEAVRKCTGLPASVMGFLDRGRVETGHWADLVVFSPEKIADTATAKEPYNKASGIEYVLVNGKVAYEKGQVRPVFSGQVLRRR